MYPHYIQLTVFCLPLCLTHPEFVVSPPVPQKILMCPALHQPSLVHHEDLVRPPHRAQPVGHGDAGPDTRLVLFIKKGRKYKVFKIQGKNTKNIIFNIKE